MLTDVLHHDRVLIKPFLVGLPNRHNVLFDMERELSDKERGLLKVSLDNQGYYRADELFHEVELVLEATCTACAAGR